MERLVENGDESVLDGSGALLLSDTGGRDTAGEADESG